MKNVIARCRSAAGFLVSFGECIPPSCCITEKCVAVMADYSSVAPPSSSAGGGMNDAFKDALQRARQVMFQRITFLSKYVL